MAVNLNLGIGAVEVVSDPGKFDRRSGNLLERVLFNQRGIILFACALITAFLGFQASKIVVNASYEGMMPVSHPHIRNFLENRDHLRGLGNIVRIVVENTQGDIFDAAYLDKLAKINDTVYLIRGVDRAWLKSLWTPLVRWTEVTEEGFTGGPVMPKRYDGSHESIEQVRINVQRAGLVGSLVSNDLHSSMIVVPLLERYPDTKEPINYRELSRLLEEKVRVNEDGKTRVYIVGFAKVVGDLIDGLFKVMSFFMVAAFTAAL